MWMGATGVIIRVTIQRLIEQHNMKPIAAFLTLDWLSREPEAAIASLKCGYDRVR